MRPGFAAFDFNAPLHLELILSSIPAGASQRGMFLNGLLDKASELGRPLPGNRRYTSFKEYSSVEGYRLSVEVAQHLYPGVPLRESFRRLGHTVYPSLLNSMIGKALFGVLGRKIEAAMRLVPKGYSLSTKEMEVSLVESSDQHALFHYRSFPNFDSSFDIGTLEGLVLYCQKTPTCLFRESSLTEAEILCSWE